MNAIQHPLQVRIHQVDGSTETFVQDDEGLIKQILGEFQPDRIFARDRFVIADRHSLTTFPIGQIVRLDLISERLPDWLLPPGVVNAVELTETEFRALLQNPGLREPWDQMQTRDTAVIVFLEVDLTGQPSLFLVLEFPGESFMDQTEVISSVFAARALCFRMHSGGVAAIHLAHLQRLTLFPGTEPVPLEAWPARRSHDWQHKHPDRNFPRPEEVLPRVSHWPRAAK